MLLRKPRAAAASLNGGHWVSFSMSSIRKTC